MSRILIVVDNSNIYVQTKKNYGLSARFGYQVFLEKFCSNDDIVAKQITGSKPPVNNDFWTKMRLVGWDVFLCEHKHDHNGGRREKGADTSIVLNAAKAIMTSNIDTLILFSGDLDMMPLVQIAKEFNCAVNLWTYSESSSYDLEEACDNVFYINDHKQDLIYHQIGPGVTETYAEHYEQVACDEWEAYVELKNKREFERLSKHEMQELARKKQSEQEKTATIWKTVGEWTFVAGLAAVAVMLSRRFIK